jgi:hypothetical protein
MKKRVLVLLTALMVLLATSVAPAYGKVHLWLCEQPDGSAQIAVGNKPLVHPSECLERVILRGLYMWTLNR